MKAKYRIIWGWGKQKTYEVENKNSLTGLVENQEDQKQLSAARCRWVNLLWKIVVSVAVTQCCDFVQPAFVFMMNYFQNPPAYHRRKPS